MEQSCSNPFNFSFLSGLCMQVHPTQQMLQEWENLSIPRNRFLFPLSTIKMEVLILAQSQTSWIFYKCYHTLPRRDSGREHPSWKLETDDSSLRWGFSGLFQDAIIHEGIPVIGLGFLSRSVLPPSLGDAQRSWAQQSVILGAASGLISFLLEICQACEVSGVSVCCMHMRSSCGAIKLQRAHSNS